MTLVKEVLRILPKCVLLTINVAFLSTVEILLVIGLCSIFGWTPPSEASVWVLSMMIYVTLVITGLVHA